MAKSRGDAEEALNDLAVRVGALADGVRRLVARADATDDRPVYSVTVSSESGSSKTYKVRTANGETRAEEHAKTLFKRDYGDEGRLVASAKKIRGDAEEVSDCDARGDATYQNPGFKRVRDSVLRTRWLSARKSRLLEAQNELKEILNSWGYLHGTDNDRKGSEYSIRVLKDRIKENEQEIDQDMRAYGPEQ